MYFKRCTAIILSSFFGLFSVAKTPEKPTQDRIKIHPKNETIEVNEKTYRAISYIEKTTFRGVTLNSEGKFPILEFNLSENTVGFSVFISHLGESGELFIKSLVPKSGGKALIDDNQVYKIKNNPYSLNQFHLSNNPYIPSVFSTISRISFPTVPSATFESGKWILQLAQAENTIPIEEIEVFIISKVLSEPKKDEGISALSVNVLLGNVPGLQPVPMMKMIQQQTGMDIFQTNLAEVRNTFAEASIHVMLDSLEALPATATQVPRDEQFMLHEKLTFFPKQNTPGSLNLILLPENNATPTGTAPIDGSSWGFTDREGFGSVIAEGSAENISSTIVHEIGHSLGLFHVEDDFLNDTCAHTHTFLEDTHDHEEHHCKNIMKISPDRDSGFSSQQIQMMLTRPILFDYNPK